MCTNLCTDQYQLELSQLSGFIDIISVLCYNKFKKMHDLVTSVLFDDK